MRGMASRSGRFIRSEFLAGQMSPSPFEKGFFGSSWLYNRVWDGSGPTNFLSGFGWCQFMSTKEATNMKKW